MSKTRKKTAGRAGKTRKRTGSASSGVSIKEPLLFSQKQYIIMGAGLLLIALGLLFMGGGSMPDPNVWEPDRIYSFRRITLAPIFILAGLGVEIYAIFKK